jgi:ABC-type Fe3+/spermidine/putrescine transport system ATPase subunit
MLEISDLCARVGSFELKSIRFAIQRGEYFVVLGPSGVGKTLLLETIAGLTIPSVGKILLRGRDITFEKIQNRSLSIVYQDADLFPHLSVYNNIAYPLRCRGDKQVDEKVTAAAAKTGIADKLDRKPDTLSGGEYQRAALARSLAADSDLFLLDEPLSSLDPKSRDELRGLLRSLNRSGITMVHVTHDYEEAISLATRIGVMDNGQLVQVASPVEIFRHPRSEFIARFVGIKNYFQGILRSIAGSELKEFSSNGIKILCLSDVPEGNAILVIPHQEITVGNGMDPGEGHGNSFQGVIRDIVQAKIGFELTVDIGIELRVGVSETTRQSLDLAIGKQVWVAFDASACSVYVNSSTS